MIEMQNDQLIFSFPQVHQHAKCTIEFQRTLRIPDDNREYPLPPVWAASRYSMWMTMARRCLSFG